MNKVRHYSLEFWLRRQASYDLAQARLTEDQLQVERYVPQTSA